MRNKNKKMVPEVRFRGFTEDWEQRKLGDVADIVGGGTPSTSIDEYWDGVIDWYAPAEITDQIYVSSSKKKITEQGFNNSSAKLLPTGTVLFTSRAGIGKTAILANKGCTNQGFQSIVPHKNHLDSYFIFSRTEELKKYGETIGAGSTFVEVSGKQMESMELMMPKTMKEQQVIGSYFKALDHLITLHQRKLALLQKIKEGFLQAMFPEKGEDVPKVRFADFEGGWEQRKLDSLVNRVKSYPLSRSAETNEYTGYKYIHYGDIHTKIADIICGSSNLPNINVGEYEQLIKGDVVLADASEDYQGIATPAIITVDLPYRLVSGLHTIALRPKGIEPLFLYYLFHSPLFKKYGSKVGTGMKVFGISLSNLLKFECKLPSQKEQKKIGMLLKELDDTTIFHQNTVEKMNLLKKAYMQKLFI